MPRKEIDLRPRKIEKGPPLERFGYTALEPHLTVSVNRFLKRDPETAVGNLVERFGKTNIAFATKIAGTEKLEQWHRGKITPTTEQSIRLAIIEDFAQSMKKKNTTDEIRTRLTQTGPFAGASVLEAIQSAEGRDLVLVHRAVRSVAKGTIFNVYIQEVTEKYFDIPGRK